MRFELADSNWASQQGSIYIFVLLIFFYAWRMNRIDKKFDVHED
jgi:putative solute:sodium symporter small subunit